MAIWADGDAISPDNMNNPQISALTVDGRVFLTSTDDVDLDGISGTLITGGDGTGQHLAFNGNEIASKSNATTDADLFLNTVGSAGRVVTGSAGMVSGGTIRVAEAPTGGGLAGDASGTTGDITWGSSSNVSFLYVCVSTDSWMRVGLDPF